jgi:hypothetical protein
VKKRWLLLGILACTSLWLAVPRRQILQLYEQALNLPHALLNGGPGDLGDLIYPWYGSRELILHHRDPYASEITGELRRTKGMQNAKDERYGQFAYPLYIALLMLPTLWLSYPSARLIFFCVQLLALLVTVKFWVQFVGWKIRPLTLAPVSVLVIISPPSLYGLIQTQITILVAAMIAGCAAALAAEHFLLAGCLLALASVKPQMIVLLAPWLVFWAAGQWSSRRKFVFGFIGTLIFLLASAELLLRGWLPEWKSAVIGYRAYAGDYIFRILAGHTLGFWLSVGLIAWLCFALREVQQESAKSEKFAIAFSLILIAELLVCPGMAFGYNQVLLIPAMLLVLFPLVSPKNIEIADAHLLRKTLT